MQINPRFKTYKLHTKKKKALPRVIWRIIRFYLIIATLHLLLVQIIAHPIEIQSSQMQPTLAAIDRVIVSPFFGALTKQAIRSGNIDVVRGQVVRVSIHHQPFFKRLFNGLLDALSFGLYSSRSDDIRLRRIVAFEGERIRLENFIAMISPEDTKNEENEFMLTSSSYTILTDTPEIQNDSFPFLGNTEEIYVEKGHVFVLSDNRSQGIDSRYWQSIPIEAIRARLVFRYWPISRNTVF